MTKSKENALTDSEIESFITSCQTPEEKFLMLTLIYSGLRVSELAHMNKSWIDWQEQTINVPSSQQCDCSECKKKGGLWTPKTKTAVRSIPFKHEIRLATTLRAFFTMHEKSKWTRVAVWQNVKKIAKRAGTQHRVYPHALRATTATLLAHKGFSAPTIQYVLGWAQLKTAEHYVQSSKRRALDEFERVYQNGK